MDGNRGSEFKERPLNSGRVSSQFALLVRKYGGSPRLLRRVKEVTKDQEPSYEAGADASGAGGSRASADFMERFLRRKASRAIDEDPSVVDVLNWLDTSESGRTMTEPTKSGKSEDEIYELFARQREQTRQLLDNLSDLVALRDFTKGLSLLAVKRAASSLASIDQDTHVDLLSVVARSNLMRGLEGPVHTPRWVVKAKTTAEVGPVSLPGPQAPEGRRAAAAELAAIERLVTSMTDRLGRDHPVVLVGRRVWAEIQAAAGDVPGARAALVDVVSDLTRIVGAAHPETVAARTSLRGLVQGSVRR
ncbi:hypothetical protein [Micromonospora sp. NPDC049203]|uniref:hypothetical protein n=1 Tax=Micromonospora sp. NPDC049203 TaxID=3364267 RepID=UPI00371D99B1